MKGLLSTSPHIIATGFDSDPQIYSSAMGGQMRYNISANVVEASDGSTWYPFRESIGSVGMNGVAEAAIDWAINKMNEEHELERLAAINPTIKSIVAEMNKYRDQIEMIKILIKDEVKV